MRYIKLMTKGYRVTPSLINELTWLVEEDYFELYNTRSVNKNYIRFNFKMDLNLQGLKDRLLNIMEGYKKDEE